MIVTGRQFYSPQFMSSKPDTDEDFDKSESPLSEHYYKENVPYQSIYEAEGRMSDYQFGNFIKGLNNVPAHPNYDHILDLPLRNVKQIDGLENSYRGQTLCFAKKECLDTIKKSGVNTVVDLVGYQGYDKKIEDSGMKFFEFKTKKLFDSKEFQSLRSYQVKQERFFRGLKEDGFDVDIEESLEYSKNKFLGETREGINHVVDFINIMREGNVYIGCESGTHETDIALMLNDAFNPDRQNVPLEIPALPILNSMFNLYYNLTPEDKAKMGWTKETDISFFDRMADRQVELMGVNN